MTAPRLLLIEDDIAFRRTLKTVLAAEGYSLAEAADGATGLELLRTTRPDLVLLDLGLPDRDGIEVLRDLRHWSLVPVIVLSARGQETAKVKALDLGADDYITKPFGTPELLARLRAALRHASRSQPPAIYENDGLVIDLSARTASREGQAIKLSKREWDVLGVLLLDAGKLVTHRQILETVWGAAHAGQSQYLWVYIGHLREKLEPNPLRPSLILTEPGIGYRLAPAPA